MIYLGAFLAAFVGVGLKAAQQLNVVHEKFALIPFFSYGLAISEVLIIASVVHDRSPLIVFCIGTGGWMGCWLSMFIHRRVRGG